MSKTDYTPKGWAMEARLNAEDPLRNFLPSAGTLGSVSFPLKDSGATPERLGIIQGLDGACPGAMSPCRQQA